MSHDRSFLRECPIASRGLGGKDDAYTCGRDWPLMETGVFSEGHQDCPSAECEVAGVTSTNELEPVVAPIRQEGRRSTVTERRTNLRDYKLDFREASRVFEGPTVTYEDDRFAYGEQWLVTL